MIRILLVAAMHLVRGALVALIDHEDGLTVVGQSPCGNGVLRTGLATRPDVVVIDVDCLDADGITMVGELKRLLPDCRILLLTNPGSPAVLRRALADHALGIVQKGTRPEYFADAVRRVARGERVVDPELAVVTRNSPNNPLTRRELDVLRLLAQGAPVEEIAGNLQLSVGTVRNYLSAIRLKTGARTRVEAIRIAEKAGWF